MDMEKTNGQRKYSLIETGTSRRFWAKRRKQRLGGEATVPEPVVNETDY
jgi:hypothetical protein